MAHHFLLDACKHSPGTGFVLHGKGNRKVLRQPVKVSDDGPANFVVRGGPRPEVRRRSAGNTGHARKGRNPKLFVFLYEEARPASQAVEEAVELRVQVMVLRDLRWACLTSWTKSRTSLRTWLRTAMASSPDGGELNVRPCLSGEREVPSMPPTGRRGSRRPG